ncbi:MAG: hypothetical protein K6A70_10725 [Erysipelotrichaceae bacterium]|nr:hypothetical protein [Erysipelotrichaceae bacterium]
MIQSVRKLKSENGASLAIALLLFLICAVVSSVVLTAGTAASGRLSKKAEMDQKYYLVNSAAELIIEELEGKAVIVESNGMNKTYKKADGTEFTPDNYLIGKFALHMDLPLTVPNNQIVLNLNSEENRIAYYDAVKASDESLIIYVRDKNTDDPEAYTLTLYFSCDKNTVSENVTSLKWFLSDMKKGKMS